MSITAVRPHESTPAPRRRLRDIIAPNGRPLSMVAVRDPQCPIDLYALIDQGATPDEGDHVIVSDGTDIWRNRFSSDHPIPQCLEILGVSRAIIIPE